MRSQVCVGGWVSGEGLAMRRVDLLAVGWCHEPGGGRGGEGRGGMGLADIHPAPLHTNPTIATLRRAVRDIILPNFDDLRTCLEGK